MRGVPRLATRSRARRRRRARRRGSARPGRRIVGELVGVVVVEAGDEAEAVAERAGDQTGARGRADEREARAGRAGSCAPTGPCRSRCRAGSPPSPDTAPPRPRAAGRWTSSMNSTSPSSRFVRIAARSPARSSAGPLVGWMRAPISVAMMPGERGLAETGRPANSTWSTAWPRCRGGGQHDLEVLAQARLADELVEAARPQRRLLGGLDRIGRRAAAARLSSRLTAPAHRSASRSRRSRSRSSTVAVVGELAERLAHLVGRVAEADERVAHLAARAPSGRRAPRERSRSGTSRRAFSSTSRRCAVRLPTPGTSMSASRSSSARQRRSALGRVHRQDRERELRADAGRADQRLERVALVAASGSRRASSRLRARAGA